MLDTSYVSTEEPKLIRDTKSRALSNTNEHSRSELRLRNNEKKEVLNLRDEVTQLKELCGKISSDIAQLKEMLSGKNKCLFPKLY